MTDQFEILWEWLPPFDCESAEGYTFADMKILVGGRVATELEDFQSQTLRKGMYVSAYPLAFFLATNWWRLRWEPVNPKDDPEWRMRHNFAAIGDGYVWPDLSFAGDGEFILVNARSAGCSKTSPIRYLADFAVWVRADVFERAISDCIEGTLARLEAVGMDKTDLASLWSDVREENADTHAALWRRLEALAGYDADEAPEAFVRDLLDAGENSGWAIIQELAAASRRQAIDDLKVLQKALQSRGVGFRIADFERIRADVQSSVANTAIPPWQRAYHAAKVARGIWGLDGKPLSNSHLADMTGIQREVLELGAGLGSVPEAPYSASIWSRDDSERCLILNRKPVTSRRFAVCRLIGDRLCGKDGEVLSAATDAGTSRQKFQRAFAQELLCPFDALMSFLDKDTPSDDDIEDAADYFQVSPRLVHATLVNHHALPRETMEEFV